MKDKNVLVTGIHGFIGAHLAALLGETFAGIRLFGIGRGGERIGSHVRVVDLLKRDKITSAIEEMRPDYIFHLAGLTHARDLAGLYRGNVEITVNLLDAVMAAGRKCRVIIPGSAAEYGQVSPEELPITESRPPKPVSPYGVVKAWQTVAAQYYATRGVDIVIGRLFNIVGKGMSDNLSVGAFASQLKKIQRHEAIPRITVGNLAPKRDFLDIDDVSRALIALAQRGLPGEIYNVCSGGSIPMADILNQLMKQIDVEVEVVVDAKKVRAADIDDSRGSNDKIKLGTGWRPIVPLDKSLAKLMN